MEERLYRSREDRMIAGVCGGLARRFGLDPTFVRILAVVALVVGNGVTLIAYLVMALVVPEAPGAGTTDARPSPGTGRADAPKRTHGGAGVTFGVFLILLGVAIIAGRMLGSLPPVWTLWPLAIVLIGAVHVFTPGKDGWGVARVADGLSTVAFGAVLLGCTTGFVGWDVWWRFIYLWPLLVVALGLAIIGKSVRSDWLGAAASVMVIGALAFATWSSWSGEEIRSSLAGDARKGDFSFTEAVGDVEQAVLDLDAAAGDVSISDGGPLVWAEGVAPYGAPEFSVARSGEEAEVRLSATGSSRTWVWPDAPAGMTEVRLSDRVLWRKVRVDSGVSSLDADLSELDVADVTVNAGLSDATLRLGDVPLGYDEASAEIKAGFANIVIVLPADAQVRVVSDSGLAPATMDPRLREADGGWQTAGYESARRDGEGVWSIRIKAAFGAVSVSLR